MHRCKNESGSDKRIVQSQAICKSQESQHYENPVEIVAGQSVTWYQSRSSSHKLSIIRQGNREMIASDVYGKRETTPTIPGR